MRDEREITVGFSPNFAEYANKGSYLIIHSDLKVQTDISELALFKVGVSPEGARPCHSGSVR